MAHLYKAINAPLGPLGVVTLKRSTTALASNDDATYNKIEDELLEITKRRNDIAARMLAMLEDSTFDGREFNEAKAKEFIEAAERLLDEVMETKEAKE
jgi:hypothetical protein